MKNSFKYIFLLLIIATTGGGCSKTDDPIISSQIDQAFIQDITLLDASAKDVVVSKSIPKIVVDIASGNERLDVAGTPLNITVTAKTGTDLSNLFIRCILTGQSKFAKVSPEMGYYTSFSTPKTYTVTSQTGKNISVYTLKVVLQ
uniref:hypothetical protein n=1 Tax=Pedobacter schmidteae TaxID=2201271 RepID=UPI000EAEE66E|nr:hypothetical protein [Pedobacter schmidteae]